MKLYGRSDIKAVSTGCDHGFKRASAPKSWNQDRTVPVSDCDVCAAVLLRLGWKDDPRKVELTPEEIEHQDLAKIEGDALTHTIAQAFAGQLAENVAAARGEQASATKARAQAAGIEVSGAKVSRRRKKS